MASYDMSSYELRFQDDYKKVLVYDTSNNFVAEYDLQASNQSVSVSIDGDDYVVAYASSFADATCTIDVGSGTTLAFDGALMGGTGIVDLRDMKEGDPDTINFTFDFECTPHKLKYVTGPFALRFLFSNEECFSYTEV